MAPDVSSRPIGLPDFTASENATQAKPPPRGSSMAAVATADRRSVRTGIAAMSEEGDGILSGDGFERGSQRLLQCLDAARGDPAKVGFHFGPAWLDRAKVRAIAGQVAIGKA